MSGSRVHHRALPGRFAIACGNWLFRYRNAAFPVVLLALLLGLPSATGATDGVLDVAGVLLAMSGQALRAAVIGFAYIKRGGVNKRIHADRLVSTGLFAHARNPLYLGNLLILTGLFLVQGNPWGIATGTVFFLGCYAVIVAAEEHFLRGRFGGDYAAYCARVPRWLPRLRGLGATVAGMRFSWRRVVLKDYGTCYFWCLGLIALFAREAYVRGAGSAVLAPALAQAAALTLGVLTIRVLKKRRLLVERSA
ncbi:MAG: isoprenylcysteine carboxylmethyltransferase family protein [Gammaproteobacteria bacterium]|nr:isoprenylcysteine carboxylmethyltransferase family protein [Gammaproteobacteria bacterium]